MRLVWTGMHEWLDENVRLPRGKSHLQLMHMPFRRLAFIDFLLEHYGVPSLNPVIFSVACVASLI